MERVGAKDTAKQTIVVNQKNKDGTMSKNGIMATFFANYADMVSVGRYKEWEEVELTIGLTATQYNGRRYQNINAYGITRLWVAPNTIDIDAIAEENF